MPSASNAQCTPFWSRVGSLATPAPQQSCTYECCLCVFVCALCFLLSPETNPSKAERPKQDKTAADQTSIINPTGARLLPAKSRHGPSFKSVCPYAWAPPLGSLGAPAGPMRLAEPIKDANKTSYWPLAAVPRHPGATRVELVARKGVEDGTTHPKDRTIIQPHQHYQAATAQSTLGRRRGGRPRCLQIRRKRAHTARKGSQGIQTARKVLNPLKISPNLLSGRYFLL